MPMLHILAIAQLAAPPGPFSPPGGGCSIQFPSKPAEKSQSAKLGPGTTSFAIASVKPSGVSSLGVSSCELPAGLDRSAALDLLMADVLAQSRSKLIDARDVEIDGVAGREIRAEIPRSVVAGGAILRVRVVATDRRGFEVIAVAEPSKADAPAIAAFLGSFRILDRSPSREVTPPTGLADRGGRRDPGGPDWKDVSSPDDGFRIPIPGTSRDVRGSTGSGTGRIDTVLFVGMAGNVLVTVTCAVPTQPLDAAAGQSLIRGFAGSTVRRGKDLPVRTIARRGLLGLAWDGPSTQAIFGPNARVRGRGHRVGLSFLMHYVVDREPSRSKFDAEAWMETFEIIDSTRPDLTPPSDWKAVSPDGGGDSVRLPREPARVEEGDASKAAARKFNLFEGSSNYAVRSADLPVETNPADHARLPIVLSEEIDKQVELREDRPITHRGLRGRETRYEANGPGMTADAIGTTRIFLAGRKLISVDYVEAGPTQPDDRGRAFLDSLEFVGR